MDIRELINSKLLQEKFNDYENNHDVFGNHEKDYYYELLHEHLRNEIIKNVSLHNYSIDYIIEFINTFLIQEYSDKPYLMDFDIVTLTLMQAKNDAETEYCDADNDKVKPELEEHISLITDMIFLYKEKFNPDFNIYSAQSLIKKYDEIIKNNLELNSKEIEEMILIYSSFNMSSEKKNQYLEYIFEKLLSGKYDVNPYIYSIILRDKGYQFLEKEGFQDVTIKFANMGKRDKSLGEYSDYSISLNINTIGSKRITEDLLTFFHEMKHALQFTYSESTPRALLFSKDELLCELSDISYYIRNHHDISYEKDAICYSYERVFKLLKEYKTENSEEVMEELRIKLKQTLNNLLQFPTERRIASMNRDEFVNFNILFEQTVKGNTNFMRLISKDIKKYSIILFEYDRYGNKRNLFDLLESRDAESNEDIKKIYDYIIYEIECSEDYILRNESILKRSKGNKYCDEVKKILDRKRLDYKIAREKSKYVEYDEKGKNDGNSYEYEKARIQDKILKHRKEIIKRYKQDGDILTYLSSEEALSREYSYLMSVLESNFQIETSEVKEESIKR